MKRHKVLIAFILLIALLSFGLSLAQADTVSCYGTVVDMDHVEGICFSQSTKFIGPFSTFSVGYISVNGVDYGNWTADGNKLTAVDLDDEIIFVGYGQVGDELLWGQFRNNLVIFTKIE